MYSVSDRLLAINILHNDFDHDLYVYVPSVILILNVTQIDLEICPYRMINMVLFSLTFAKLLCWKIFYHFLG